MIAMLSVFCSVFPGLKNYKKSPPQPLQRGVGEGFLIVLIHTNLSQADIESG